MSNRSMRNLVAFAFAPLTACTSLQPADSAPSAIDACLPAILGRFTGHSATSELGARMLASTGKTVLRWVPTGTMVTMDFREDRLTVYLDASHRVERASCG